MKIPDRDTAVFSTSAIDLFASALGAFILLVMLLFPYYRNAGPAEAFARTQDIMQQHRQASAQSRDQMAEQDILQNELEQLNGATQRTEQYISRLRKELAESREQLAQIPVEIPTPAEIILPEEEPRALTDGVEFSILGLASESKSFVLVVDMSGSMMNYEDLMLRSLLEILEPLDESKQFAIVGYQGNPEPLL